MDREELCAAALVSHCDRASVKLPLLLTARPGNVGVQIDAFRTMKMFNRPRCGKFTAQFQGINFENHSMENYARVVERSHARARIVAERLDKLKQYEAKLMADEQSRRQRRREREMAEQRHEWLLRQAAKKAEQRAREEGAAQTIQRIARGAIARRATQRLRVAKKEHSAATCLQTSLRAYTRRRQSVKLVQERDEEQRLRAARTIQRHARKRQASSRSVNNTAVPTAVECEQPTETTNLTIEPTPLEPPPTMLLSADAHEDIDLNLVFSQESTTTTSPHFLPLQQQLQPSRPRVARRPVAIKRVGGGFRHSPAFQSPRLRTSRPPALAEAIAPRPPPPRLRVSKQGDADADDALLALVAERDVALGPLELSLDSGTGTGTNP